MRTRHVLISCAILFSAAFSGEVFADETRTEPVSETPVVFETASGSSGTWAVAIASEKEKQKAIDDVNAFLIESYKIKLDKLLDDVYRSVRTAAKDDPALQAMLLKRVLAEINAKMDSIAGRNITPNRKKILLSVFSYLKKDIETKIASFGQN